MTDKNFKLLQYELLRLVENGVSYYRNFDCFNYEHETYLFDGRNSLVIRHLPNEKISIYWLHDQVDLFEYVVNCNYITDCLQYINDYYTNNITKDFGACMCNISDIIFEKVHKRLGVYKLYDNVFFRDSILYIDSDRYIAPDIVVNIGDGIISIGNSKSGFRKIIETSRECVVDEITRYIKELFKYEGVDILLY